MLPKTVPCGGDKPRNCLPQKRSPTQQPQAPPQLQQVHASSDAAATETNTSQSHANGTSSLAGMGWVLRVPRAVVAAGEGDKVLMIPGDWAVCDLNTSYSICHSNRRWLITSLLKGASLRSCTDIDNRHDRCVVALLHKLP